jgi:3-oxoacyl-[acyl-carrier protein] reductase
MPGVEGRVALVTGASQGIGRACALLLAQGGAQVALAARNEEKLAATKAQIETAGGKAETFRLDVANEDEVKAVFKAVVAKFGRLEILVNNAGITRDQLLMRMKRADWDAVLGTNLTGAYLCTQAAVSPMLKQRWGRIINITSIFGQIGQTGQANYCASKAGLIGLTKSVARELGSRSITCNAVAPGWIETDMTKDLAANLKEQVLKMIPLGRAGTDVDVAHAVRFLASEEAGYITGHVLDVNGGMRMG